MQMGTVQALLPWLIGCGVLVGASLLIVVHLLSPKSNVLRLSTWPSVIWLYSQTVCTLFTKRAAKGDPSGLIKGLPVIQVTMSKPVAFNASRFQRFLRLCGHNGTAGYVPLMYPIAEAFKLSIQAMLLPAFPFRILGSVLARNTTTLYRPIRAEERLLFRVTISPSSWRTTAKRDVEADLVCEAMEPGPDQDVVWRSTTTVIILNPKRTKAKNGSKEEAPTPAPPIPRKLELIDSWRLAGDVGRKYGMINGDLNPIHIHPLTSRLFGFKRPIAHALYLVSRAEASLRAHGLELTYPAVLATEFKRPTLLPAKLEVRCDVDALKASSGVAFAITSEHGDKDVLVGQMTCGGRGGFSSDGGGASSS